MSCRNPNVDDCMANDTQSYTETFSNENSNDSSYWSDYQETLVRLTGQTQETKKYTEKKRLPIRIFVLCMLPRLSKSECFFFKNESSLNQFQ